MRSTPSSIGPSNRKANPKSTAVFTPGHPAIKNQATMVERFFLQCGAWVRFAGGEPRNPSGLSAQMNLALNGVASSLD